MNGGWFGEQTFFFFNSRACQSAPDGVLGAGCWHRMVGSSVGKMVGSTVELVGRVGWSDRRPGRLVDHSVVVQLINQLVIQCAVCRLIELKARWRVGRTVGRPARPVVVGW